MDVVRLPLGKDFAYGCLRSLRDEDVGGMLSWMHDLNTVRHFARDFTSTTEREAAAFVCTSWRDAHNAHLAVEDERGAYLGTVSLKEVDVVAGNAEYAIAMTVQARGTGAALTGTRDILELAFEGFGLREVWLCVRESNVRAQGFYAKVGFTPRKCCSDDAGLRYFGMSKGEYGEVRRAWG